MAVGLAPSWYLGVCRDQKAGAIVMAWGLDATAQLAGTGQVVTLPVCTVADLYAGGADVSGTLLSGGPSIGPNAAGLASMVVTQALTGAVAGHTYRLTVLYTPSPPSPAQEQLPLVLDFLVID